MKKRFTILKHETEDSIHVDFLLENDGERLWTWRIDDTEVFFSDSGVFTVTAVQIPDHRKVYLDFEGEIPGNRGHVSQVDTGMWRLVRHDAREFVIETESRFYSGAWQFLASEPDSDPPQGDWSLTYFNLDIRS